MKSNFLGSKLMMALVSCFLTLALFVYVNDSLKSTSANVNSPSTQTVSNIPVNVQLDTKNYMVTGLPDTVSVRLEGKKSAVLLLINNNSFKVETPNLTKLGPGDHTIELQVTGSLGDVKASVTPDTVSVHIEEKQTIEKEVTLNVNRDNIPTSYTIGKAMVQPSKVKITGAASVISQIDSVVANVVLPDGTNANYQTSATVKAYDASGEQLSLEMNPATVSVDVPVNVSSKTVPVKYETYGESSDLYEYSVTSATTTVTLIGKESVLSDIQSVTVPIDVSSITESTSQTVTIPTPKNVSSSMPESAKVTIQIKSKKSETTTSN